MPQARYTAETRPLERGREATLVELTDHQVGLRATVAPEFGAELSSLQLRQGDDWAELLYRANDFSPTADGGWRGRAPLLWPAVGRNYTAKQLEEVKQLGEDVWTGSYEFRDSVFPMPTLGFIMDREWSLEECRSTDEEAVSVCSFVGDPEARKFYPFDFRLEASCTLLGGQVALAYRVTNSQENDEALFFSIGNHISVALPPGAGPRWENAVLRSPANVMFGITEQSLLSGEAQPIALPQGIALSDPLIHNTVVGGLDPEAAYVDLLWSEGRGLRVSQREVVEEKAAARLGPEDFYFVFYAEPEKGYFCPEPWVGAPNSLNTGEGVVTLAPGEEFTWVMEIDLLGIDGDNT